VSEARLRFALEPANVSRLLFGAIAVLGVVHLAAMAVYFGKLGPPSWNADLRYWHIMFFDLDEEESFGTWFSTGLLLAAAVLLLVQMRVSRATGDGLHRGWLVLAVGFFALSADEVAGMHEYLNTMVENTRWTTFALMGVPIAGAALLRLPWRTSGRFVLAGAIYCAGAVLLERWSPPESEIDTFGYSVWVLTEEVLEMAGISLFICALLDHIRGEGRHCYLDPVGVDEGTAAALGEPAAAPEPPERTSFPGA
jgi:hypothetical protein